MRRIAFYLFYDKDGIVDDYIIYKLQKLSEFVDTIFVVSNSQVDKENRKKIENVCDTFFVRENIGFDVWGYKEAMESFGREKLRDYDELILLNYTFFGPIFPFSELFSSMENRHCDFWGISAHKEVEPNPVFDNKKLPLHIQSHFIAVRRNMFTSKAFEDYWDNMPMIQSYYDSILKHESRFTEHFHQQGFTYEVYLDPQDYSSDYALFESVELAMKNRSPILKKRIFVHDPIYLEQKAIFPRRAMEYIQAHSDYDINLIWKSVVRAAEPRTLYTNMDMLEILSTDTAAQPPSRVPRIAVIAHMYYSDMMAEILGYLEHIPYKFDLYIATDNEEKKAEMLSVLNSQPDQNVEIRVTGQNRGRDMATYFVTFQDIQLSDKYDVTCCIHSKKSLQNGLNVGQYFKEHQFANLLYNKNYVSNILDLFDKEPQLGIVMPPVVHIGYPTLGHSWFINLELTKKWAKKMGIDTIFDASTPLAPYGTMYWSRPMALRKLTGYKWKPQLQDFEFEIGEVDGTLPHALERLIVYAAMDSGYYARCVMNPVSAAVAYTKLEYKLQRVAALMPNGYVRNQIDWLMLVQAHLAKAKGVLKYSGRQHLRMAISLANRRFTKKFPFTAKVLMPVLSLAKIGYRKMF